MIEIENYQQQYLTSKLIVLFLYQTLNKKRQFLLEWRVDEKMGIFPNLNIVIKTNLTLKNYEINKILTKIGVQMGLADFCRLTFVFNHKKYKARFPKSNNRTRYTSNRNTRLISTS